MNNREIMQAVTAGEDAGYTPQWFIAFETVALAEKLMPPGTVYDGYAEFTTSGGYGYGPMGIDRLRKARQFNRYIDKCAFPVGWGANAAFGHAGPGEYGKKVIRRNSDFLTLEYETGVLKDIHFSPHFQHIYGHPVRHGDDLEQLVLPDPADVTRYEGIREDITWARSEGEWTVAFINGFFSGIHYFFREYQQFFLDFYDDIGLVQRLIEKNGRWTLKAAEMLCRCGIDCLGFCDDLGSGTSMLISPDAYREFVWPWHRKLCELAHSHGVKVHMHSHGHILPIVSDLADAGIDILNPLDPDEGMQLDIVRELAGPDMVLCGGLDKHFFDWDSETKQAFLQQTVMAGRSNGPFILMDSGGIPGNVTADEFTEFLDMSRLVRHA